MSNALALIRSLVTFLFLAILWVALMGGFRSIAVLLAMTFAIPFYHEGLFRSQLLPMLVLAGVLLVVLSLPLVNTNWPGRRANGCENCAHLNSHVTPQLGRGPTLTPASPPL